MSKTTRKILLSAGVILALFAIGLLVYATKPQPKYRGATYQTITCDLVDLTNDGNFDIMLCDGGLTVPLAEAQTQQAWAE